MLILQKNYIKKNSYLNEQWIFINKLEVMINKEVLTQFVYKSTKSIEKLFTMKNIYLAMYNEERG